MATAVLRAITKGEKLLVEAGTGVGKSFSYLVPAAAALAVLVAEVDGDELQPEGQDLGDGVDTRRELGGDAITEQLGDAMVRHDSGDEGAGRLGLPAEPARVGR